MISLTYNSTFSSKFYSSYLQTSYSYQEDKGEDTMTLEKEIEETKPVEESPSKERVLTYYRNELLITPISDIAYIYLEYSITYVVDLNGKRSVSNQNLETLFSLLDNKLFFRVNRQIIINIRAIQKIIKKERGQLKIETCPGCKKPIYVGKNKSVAFKQWLNS